MDLTTSRRPALLSMSFRVSVRCPARSRSRQLILVSLHPHDTEHREEDLLVWVSRVAIVLGLFPLFVVHPILRLLHDELSVAHSLRGTAPHIYGLVSTAGSAAATS